MIKKVLIISVFLLSSVIGIFHFNKQRNVNKTLMNVAVSSKEDIVLCVRPSSDLNGLPVADRIEELFNTMGPKSELVDTVRYTSRVDWKKDKKPAWLADYATHFETSKHFIARSLNATKDYLKQEIKQGDHFNVLKKQVQFYMLVDLSRSRAWLYGLNEQTKKSILLKTYLVGLGTLDPKSESGCQTPLGLFKLQENVASYREGVFDQYQNKKTEMIQVFGTRWIPMKSGLQDQKGLGLHGCPWKKEESGQFVEERYLIGQYLSDGCVRFLQEDIEEIYSICISKPTFVEVVQSFDEATFLKEGRWHNE
jgi:hypothetical protein